MNYLIAIGVALAILAGVYQTGRNSAHRECNAAALRAEIQTLQADLAAQKRAAEDATQRAVVIKQQADQNEEKVRALETEVAKRPETDRCGATIWDLDRLRGIGPSEGVPVPPVRPGVR